MRERTLPDRSLGTWSDGFSMVGKRPAPQFMSDVRLNWFKVQCSLAKEATQLDFAWVLARNIPVKLYDVNIEQVTTDSPQSVPGWSAFNASITSRFSIKRQ